MPETLLRTKLFVPPVRPNLVPRPRLIQLLDQGLQQGHKLTLVSAPAGFGKSTLVSEWVHSRQLNTAQESQSSNQIAWLSLDENDNDPNRFLTYLVAALNRVKGSAAAVGQAALGMLQSSRPAPVEDVLTALVNDLTTVTGRIILVLDDYHLIDAPAVDEALNFLLEYLPPQLHLVIATRDDPQLPLSRLRARGQLTEIRAIDLRFSAPEAAEFLNKMMGLELPAEDIAALETRTEGWIAGLRLAAISMQGHKDATGFINSFAGSHRFVLDYLIEEVLDQQSESIQTFLLETAVLDRLTGSLCDALTGRNDGQEMLESLEQSNLFIIALDDERQWYRYHHLFSDLLRQQLRQSRPEQLPTLHNLASEWYEQHGYAKEAIEHSLDSSEFEQAAQLIEKHIDALWSQREHGRLPRWLAKLPEETRFARPYICIFHARYLCNSGQLDAAERTLQVVERALEIGAGNSAQAGAHKKYTHSDSNRARLRGRAAATRALMCSYLGDVPGIIQYGHEALRHLPGEDLTWRSVTALALGNAHGFMGDMAAAYEARHEALKACKAAGDVYFVLIAKLELAITLREQGHLRETIEICRQQMQFAREHGMSQMKAAGWLLAVWGETLAELGDLAGALNRANEGFRLTERRGDLQMFGWSFMCLIRVLMSRGELAAAEKIIQKVESIARESQIPPWIEGQIAAWQTRLWLAQGKLAAATHWAEERGLDAGEGLIPLQTITFFSLFDSLVLARVLIAQERLDDTVRLLEHLFKAAAAGGRTSSVIEILILRALTFQAGGQTDLALSALEQSLALGEPEGFVRVFVDEGRPLTRLLQAALKRGIAPDYVRRLLAAFSAAEPGKTGLTTSPADQAELVEPLSERELEVLQLIAEGLTNPEIASRLYLSLNTIKVHTRNIYSKLGAHSRTQAVAKARALGILTNN